MTPIEEAIAELESLKLGESINYTEVAKKYGVNRTTLSRGHRGVQRPKEDQYENQRVHDSAYKYTLYFELLARKIHQYDIQAEDIYNMDEKGFLIGILPKGKQIFSKQQYKRDGLKQHLQDGNQKWITTIACICADGSKLSPGLIYQSQASNLQNTWIEGIEGLDPKKHRCFFTSSPSGWTNNNIGYAWLRDVFNEETKDKARRRWRLLILDGHGSHVDQRFIQYYKRSTGFG